MSWLLSLLKELFAAFHPMPVPDVHAPEAPVVPLEAPPQPVLPEPNKVPMIIEKLYQAAKDSLGQHMTMNNAIPISVGCAQAVSAVLHKAGIKVPAYGISGTYELLTWLKNNPNFKEVDTQDPGTIIVSATGTGNGKIRGHTGILGENGIMSNESQSGLFREQWDMQAWDNYYTRYGAIPKHYFQPVG